MTLSGRPPMDEDLQRSTINIANQAALLEEIITESIGIGWKQSFAGFTSDVTVDISYRTQVPAEDSLRMEFLLEKAESIFETLLPSPSRRAKDGLVILKREVLEMMMCLIRFMPARLRISGTQAERRMKAIFQRRAFQFFKEVLQLSTPSFARMAHEAIICGIKILQGRGLQDAQDIANEYCNLCVEIYQFLVISLDSPSTASLFTSANIRDLLDRAVVDIRDVRLEDAAASCLTLIVQTKTDLKTDCKNQTFSAAVAGLKFHLQAIAERRFTGSHVYVASKLFTLISALILSTSVHIGILNVCNALFRDGLAAGEISISVICRQGLQIIDTLLRPRVPRDVFERSSIPSEPLTCVNAVFGESYYIQPSKLESKIPKSVENRNQVSLTEDESTVRRETKRTSEEVSVDSPKRAKLEESEASVFPKKPEASFVQKKPEASVFPEKPEASVVPEKPEASFVPKKPEASVVSEKPPLFVSENPPSSVQESSAESSESPKMAANEVVTDAQETPNPVEADPTESEVDKQVLELLSLFNDNMADESQ